MQTNIRQHDHVQVNEGEHITQSISLRGYVDVYIMDKQGNVKLHRHSNMITNIGKQLVYNFLASTSQNPVSQNVNFIAVGIGNRQPSQSDQALQTEIGRKQIQSKFISDQFLKFAVQFEMNEQNPPAGQAITEAGLFANATAATNTGQLVARALFQPAVLKQPDEMLVVVWTITLS